MDTELTPRPTENRSKRYPDHAKIFGIYKPNPHKPNYGLHCKGGKWQLLYYDKDRKTRMMNLFTDDVEVARFRRDDLYKKAARLGRGAKSQLQFYAEQILRDPSTNHGLKYVVIFANRKAVFDSEEQAKKERARICKEVIASGQLSKRQYLSPVRSMGGKQV